MTAAPVIKGQHYNDQKFLECGAAAECTIILRRFLPTDF